MPTNMFKVFFFSQTITADLNKCIDKKVVLHAYNNLCISQIGVWKVSIAQKDILRSNAVSL